MILLSAEAKQPKSSVKFVRNAGKSNRQKAVYTMLPFASGYNSGESLIFCIHLFPFLTFCMTFKHSAF